MVAPNKRIFNIPNTDTSKLHHLITQHSHSQAPLSLISISQIGFFSCDENAPHIDPAKFGVMLEEPAQRLLNAFRSINRAKGCNQLTFKEFYTNPNRVNLYYRLLSKTVWEGFGFIGLAEQFYQSTLLCAEWMETHLYRLPYDSMFLKREYIGVSEEDEKAIKQLYDKDYAIYEKAKLKFIERWNQYQKKKQISLADTKQIFIHLGPPKTGTSAIQSWLYANRKQLAEKGVYYPEHTTDANGVSSGNFERIISSHKLSSKHYFDFQKGERLINEFNKSDKKVLLLSSEHFYYYLIWFFSVFPQAKYIFYIRHPLAIAESGFHQEVKRHNRTTPFSIRHPLTFASLDIVERIAAEFNCSVEYRYFDKVLYTGGTLLSDFATSIGSDIRAPTKVRKLNTQYSPGAISLMMACNKFASESLKTQLDTFLQKYSESYPAFSFVSSQEFNAINNALVEGLNKRHYESASPDKKQLTKLVASYQVPQNCDERAERIDIYRIVELLTKTESTLAVQLYNEAKAHNAKIANEKLHVILEQDAKFRVKRYSITIKNAFKTKALYAFCDFIRRLWRP